MGLEPFLISPVWSGCSQRLLRRVLRLQDAVHAGRTRSWTFGWERERSRPSVLLRQGLPNRRTGYKGRKAICEFMVMNPKLSQLIYENAPTMVIQNAAISMGMRTLREDGVLSILAGETSVDEVLRYT